MAVPTHFRFVVRGSFLGTPEHWSIGCKFSRVNLNEPDAGIDDVDESAVTTAVSAAIQTTKFQSQVSVDDWRMYQIGTNGFMEGNAPLLHTYTAGTVHGTGNPFTFPTQISLVVSLIAVNKGPAKYGRMYLPGPNVGLDSSGRIGTADASAYASFWSDFLKNVSDCIDLESATSSAGVNVSPGPQGSTTGTIQEIDHLEVGRVLDTVTNRRKSLLEERVAGGHIDW